MSFVLVLTASPSRTSRTAALGRHVAEHLDALGHETEVLDLRSLPADALLAADTSDPQIRGAVETLLRADGVVVATPIFKAAYSGLLKVFLDLLPQKALDGKAVLPLATGGTVAHLLAIDYALRPVLVSLGAHHISTGRFVLDQHVDHSGGPVLADESTALCIEQTAEAFDLTLRAATAPRLPRPSRAALVATA